MFFLKIFFFEFSIFSVIPNRVLKSSICINRLEVGGEPQLLPVKRLEVSSKGNSTSRGLGSIQIVSDTFWLDLNFFQTSRLKWIRNKVSHKSLPISCSQIWHSKSLTIKSFKNQKNLKWHFVTQWHPPLVCHILFEWPLTPFFSGRFDVLTTVIANHFLDLCHLQIA